jgi:crotonobetainyl-CoA:carnitine CoA-transferase CaiB-like acyl-CoA transferase
MWEDLARAIARSDLLQDPRFRDVMSRKQHAEALDQEIEKWMHDKRTEEALAILRRHNVASGPVLDIPALVAHPQFTANETIATVDVPGLGPVPLLAPPIKMDDEAKPHRRRPPRQGEHTNEVLAEWLGLPESEIEQLRAASAF